MFFRAMACHLSLHTQYLASSAVAIVGLELTFSEVSEDVDVVELCAVVYQPANMECPIAFTFYILLSTRDGTAGK